MSTLVNIETAGMRRVASRELLGEALEIAKAHLDPVALDAYRMDYAAYRLGSVKGARGELPGRADVEKERSLAREQELMAELKKATEELAKAKVTVEELTKTTRDLEAVRDKYATDDSELSETQLQAREALRRSMGKRHEARVGRVQRATAHVASRTGVGPIECSKYCFTTGAPVVKQYLEHSMGPTPVREATWAVARCTRPTRASWRLPIDRRSASRAWSCVSLSSESSVAYLSRTASRSRVVLVSSSTVTLALASSSVAFLSSAMSSCSRARERSFSTSARPGSSPRAPLTEPRRYAA
mmetsp:Transcript_21832/g.65444  ORF Transcript_21832/g.65444 Transcript_21832/m.65444 type:complete len:300 (-) Transcript_21832:314-1213(-)